MKETGRGGKLIRKAPPHVHRAEALVQQHNGGRDLRTRADHAVFEPRVAEIEKPLVRKRHRASLVALSAGRAAPAGAAPARQRFMISTSFFKLRSTVSPDVSSST